MKDTDIVYGQVYSGFELRIKGGNTRFLFRIAYRQRDQLQSVELQRRLREEDPATFTAGVTGLEPTHPLFASVEDVVRARQAQL